MNSSAAALKPASIFAEHRTGAQDPILVVTEAFVADQNPNKVNLGVGVYCDDSGKVPLLECVRKAEALLVQKARPRPTADRRHRRLRQGGATAAAGRDSPIIAEKRAITVQALGGTGGLKLGADFLKKFGAGSEVWISDPSWENHRALFEYAGFQVKITRTTTPPPMASTSPA